MIQTLVLTKIGIMAESPMSMTELQRKGQWDETQLEGNAPEGAITSPKKNRFGSLKRTKSKGPSSVSEWGFPGELTHEQYECYVSIYYYHYSRINCWN